MVAAGNDRQGALSRAVERFSGHYSACRFCQRSPLVSLWRALCAAVPRPLTIRILFIVALAGAYWLLLEFHESSWGRITAMLLVYMIGYMRGEYVEKASRA